MRLTTKINPQDYHAFGSVMAGRSFSNEKYRFKWNGKDAEPELFEGCLTFEARIFDNRICRWLSTDPREGEYAWQSTYAYFKNNVISIIDFNGEGGKFEEENTPTENVETENNSTEKKDVKFVIHAKWYQFSFTKRINIQIENLKKTDVGKEMIEKLKGQEIHIVKGKINEFKYAVENSKYTKYISLSGKRKDEPLIVHEFTHYIQFVENRLEKLRSEDFKTPDLNDEYTVDFIFENEKHKSKPFSSGLDMAEIEAMDFENRYRAERGLKLREFYGTFDFEYNVIFETYRGNVLQETTYSVTSTTVYLQVVKNGKGVHPDYATDYLKNKKC